MLCFDHNVYVQVFTHADVSHQGFLCQADLKVAMVAALGYKASKVRTFSRMHEPAWSFKTAALLVTSTTERVG